MDKPTQLQTIIDRHDTRIVEEEKPVLKGQYRIAYRAFIVMTLIQIAYLFAAHWEGLRAVLDRVGLNIFAPIHDRLAVFSFTDEPDFHLHTVVAGTAIWGLASIQDKDYSIVRWSGTLLGVLAINYGLLPWLDDSGQPFVLYWACVAFILGQTLSVRLMAFFHTLKGRFQISDIAPSGLILLMLGVGLVIYPYYALSALAGAGLGLWIVLKRVEVSV
ncbi:MAG: hypothetical protein QM667_09565 [Asticcacaulis sp.]